MASNIWILLTVSSAILGFSSAHPLKLSVQPPFAPFGVQARLPRFENAYEYAGDLPHNTARAFNMINPAGVLEDMDVRDYGVRSSPGYNMICHPDVGMQPNVGAMRSNVPYYPVPSCANVPQAPDTHVLAGHSMSLQPQIVYLISRTSAMEPQSVGVMPGFKRSAMNLMPTSFAPSVEPSMVCMGCPPGYILVPSNGSLPPQPNPVASPPPAMECVPSPLPVC